MGLLTKVKSWFGGSTEGQWLGPFHGFGELGGVFELDPLEDGWQRNLSLSPYLMEHIPAIAGAIHLHSSAGAQLRPQVLEFDKDRNVTERLNSVAARVLSNPNPYETGSDFNARVFQYVVTHGMACIVGFRNTRFEIDQMHVLTPSTWNLYIDQESKEPFVMLNQDGVMTKLSDATMMIPMRDVFIFKWKVSNKNPLLGDSPFNAAGISASIFSALSRSQIAFFKNFRRPSGVLVTDELLSPEQMRQLRTAFDEQSAAMRAGGIPILAGGLKWNPMALNSQDAQVIETIKMSNEEIARAVGVPPPLLGQLENANLSNIEQLISHWMSVSLGGLIERYERGLDRLFGYNSIQRRIEMDTTALLRTDLAERMQSYGRAIQNGVMSPNEVRRKEGLSPVEGGDDIFLQRQVTSVSLLQELNANELNNEPASNDESEDQSEDEDVKDDESDDDQENDNDEKFNRLESTLKSIQEILNKPVDLPDDNLDAEYVDLIVRDAIAKAMADTDSKKAEK